MNVVGLHHYTLRCDAGQLGALRAFYESVFGLQAGPRPTLRFDGCWLYAGLRPIVHLYASGQAAAPENMGLDHIAFEGQDVAAMRRHLAAIGVPYTEAPVPGWPLTQVFVKDPLGLKVEITFRVDPDTAAEPAA